jgi:hypothetical protein
MLSHINSSMNHRLTRKQLKVPLLFSRAWRPTTILSYMFLVGLWQAKLYQNGLNYFFAHVRTTPYECMVYPSIPFSFMSHYTITLLLTIHLTFIPISLLVY